MSTAVALARLEALLFAVGDPISKERLKTLLDCDLEELETLVKELKCRYEDSDERGLRITEIKGCVLLTTKPETSDVVGKLYADGNAPQLSQAAYETLAVIAYNEPVTRAEIEAVRGVNSDSIISRLLERDLVELAGTLDVPGRPSLLRVTDRFLTAFGLGSTKELPPIGLLRYDAIRAPEEELRDTFGLEHRNLNMFSQIDVAEDKEEQKMQDISDEPLVVAVDGPSGAGKSTLAQALAQALDILFLDTGAMYRALGLKALRCKIAPDDAAAVEQMLAQTDLAVRLNAGKQETVLDGEDVSAQLRSPEVSLAASAISAVPACRHYCVTRQRALAKQMPLILDGRDIGSYVLPDAPVKFFVTAKPEIRAQRRLAQMQEKGDFSQTFAAVLADMEQRDLQDKNRALAPTKQAEDAILLDTSDLTVDEALTLMVEQVNAVLASERQ